MTAHFDVAVVGLGAMGSAAIAHLAAPIGAFSFDAMDRFLAARPA
ncbi:hypothetical protein [Pararhizobium sp. LjRoot238]